VTNTFQILKELLEVTPFYLQACLAVNKQVLQHFLKFVLGKWSKYMCFIVLESSGTVRATVVYFCLHIAPEITTTVTTIRGSRRPESFADYTVLKHLAYSIHGLFSSIYCNIIFLEIHILYFSSHQLVEKRIQYIAHKRIWFTVCWRNILPMIHCILTAYHTFIFTLCNGTYGMTWFWSLHIHIFCVLTSPLR
jgi:hypothetical protein